MLNTRFKEIPQIVKDHWTWDEEDHNYKKGEESYENAEFEWYNCSPTPENGHQNKVLVMHLPGSSWVFDDTEGFSVELRHAIKWGWV
jgi:hypothetical protein